MSRHQPRSPHRNPILTADHPRQLARALRSPALRPKVRQSRRAYSRKRDRAASPDREA
jgi:hypothetical protein